MFQKKLVLVVFLFSLPVVLNASHMYGADFYYQHISDSTYKLTLAVYADCGGSAFPLLANSAPQVVVYDDAINSNASVMVQNLTLTGPGVEVTPVCNAQISNTTCNSTIGSVPGVSRFIYSGNITLPHTSTAWRFRFNGNMANSSSAGRSMGITNIVNAGSSLMNLDAQLNNANGNNSSPQFTTIPTPFSCVNVPQQYNQGAVDPDGDLLVYSLATALDATGPVTYVTGYSPTSPLATSSPISFSTVTGQLGFTPNQVQKSVVVNKVTEYRNGVIVGTATREMTFIVLGTCNGSAPLGSVDSTVGSNIGGLPYNGSDYVVCYGSTTPIHFNINPTDPEGDSINVTVNGLPAGASTIITNNNTTAPIVAFNWNTNGMAPGNYTFYITYKDFGCPLSNQQTIAYTVRIVKPNEFTSTVISPTQCLHKARVQYNLAYGLTPRTIVISQGSNILKTITDTASTLIDSLAPGTYTFNISSRYLTCASQYTVTIVDSGTFPFKPVFTSPIGYCKGDIAVPLLATPTNGATVRWYNTAGSYLPTTPIPATNTAGVFNYLVSQKYSVCESVKDTFTVYVTERPIASILAPANICSKDTASISFNGSVGVGPIIGYQWTWDGANYIQGTGAGPYMTHWNTSGVKTLTLQVFENLCPSLKVSQQITVKPTPESIFSLPSNGCVADTIHLQYNVTPLAGAQYTWGFADANVAEGSNEGPYNLLWNDSGVKHITLEVSLNGCIDTSSRNINIHPSPVASILNSAGSVCIGDKIYLLATGGGSYSWSPEDKLFYEPDGSLYTRVVDPITYTVSVKNVFGCVSKDSIRFDQIQPCCTFSYPDAFSPNNDGRNDTYHVITYGNQLAFEFSIYDRWGHRIFYTFDPKAAWDGTYNSKPCATGTYFYILKSRCYTGHDEVHKGDFQLLR